MDSLNPQLYSAIFTRKSTRDFARAPLSRQAQDGIQDFLGRAVPLLPGQAFAFQLVPDHGDTQRLLAFCEDAPLSRLNLGFMLQQADLYLHAQGLGSLWYGTGRKPAQPEAQHPPLRYGICLRVGVPKGQLERAAAGDFKRRPPESITGDAASHELLEPVRLAPSAINDQPWFFTRSGDTLRAYCRKHGPIKALVYAKLNDFDMGIALCHLALSIQHAGMRPEPVIEPNPPALDGYIYTVSMQMASAK